MKKKINNLIKLPELIQKTLQCDEKIQIIAKDFSKLNQLKSVYGGQIMSQTPQTRPIKTKGFKHLNTLTVTSKRYTPLSTPYFGKHKANSTETVKMQGGVVKIMRYK